MKIIRSSVDNPVAVNILMFAIIFFGLYKGLTITREFFPQVELDLIVVETPYPGATPEDVEKGINTKIENAIEGVQGIERVTANSFENRGIIVVKIDGGDPRIIADDIQTEIDRITDFPEEAEETKVTIVEQQVPVISVVMYGNTTERRLKRLAEEVEDDLLASPLISKAIISGTRQEEIAIELDPEKLDAYGLTFQSVGVAVASNNIDLASGEIKSDQGRIVVRTLGERDAALQMEDILIRSDSLGSAVRLGQVANVRDTFEERELRGSFQGKRAAQVTVFKRSDEDAIKIARWVKEYIKEKKEEYAGESIQLDYRVDLARFIQERLELLSRNALQGLVLVFIALTLFLNFQLACWVAVGLVVSFLGTFVLMDVWGATINLISLFGLILVIGLIVDDAIVVAENIYFKLEEGREGHVAAVEGAEEVVRPVIATVLTTIVAFAPLAFVDGLMGDFMSVLPIVVIASLALSLLESFTMLPSHLAEYGKVPKRWRVGAEKSEEDEPALPNQSQIIRVSREMIQKFNVNKDKVLGEGLVNKYVKLLHLAVTWRYVTIAAAVFVSLFTVALVIAGFLPFVLFQDVDSETLVAELEMANGVEAIETERALKRIGSVVQGWPEVKSVYTVVGFKEEAEVQAFADPATIGEVVIELVSAEIRQKEGMRTSDQITNQLRESVGVIPGALNLKYRSRDAGPGGPEIELFLRGSDPIELAAAVRYVKETMTEYVGVKDLEDDQDLGKLEVRVEMKESARSLGLDVEQIARQLRGAFFGFEAQTLQRGQEEVEVWVRLAEDSREKLSDLIRLRIQTPSGERVPLGEVATLTLQRGLSSIKRVDGQRTVVITSDVDTALANTQEISTRLEEELDENLNAMFSGVTFSFEGRKKELSESIGSLAIGFPVALILIYCILAVLFKSYVQPLMVMVAIPFAIVGASLGHLVFGFIPGRDFMPVTFLSMIGMVGLSGIVVNDSLILVSFINNARRKHGEKVFDAIMEAGRRRFRPIILTSITTVLGLFPIMLEKSFQAQFLIPMAIAISFGLALATVITLLILPCLYMVNEDLKMCVRWLLTGKWERVKLSPDHYLEAKDRI